MTASTGTGDRTRISGPTGNGALIAPDARTPDEQPPYTGWATAAPPATGTSTDEPAPHVLDNPARTALTGPHALFAEWRGRLLRYPVDVTPWLALPDDPGPADWADLAALAGPGGEIELLGYAGPLPEDWEVTFAIDGVQMTGEEVEGAADPEAVPLGPADVPEMLDLVARTRPGPFLPRTIELGTYLGVRHGGRLVAMAGERLHPPGWTEISAVCTDPEARGQGLGTRLIHAVAHGIRARGDLPFLHTAAGNTNAIRLYEALGFRLRHRTRFRMVRAPQGPQAPPTAHPA